MLLFFLAMLPDSATRSTMLSFCLLNLVRIVWKVLFGAGMLLLEPLKLALFESLLPSGTSQFGPPDCNMQQQFIVSLCEFRFGFLHHATYRAKNVTPTSTVESLAARAIMSAQDTVLGHSFSNADLISSITSNPRAEFWFGTDLFSVIMFLLLSNRIDASQPCNIQN